MSVTVALGWALLQFLWQGALLGLLAKMLLVVLRRHSAALRYAVAVGALVSMPASVAFSAWRGITGAPRADGAPQAALPADGASGGAPSQAAVPPAAAGAASGSLAPPAAGALVIPPSLRQRVEAASPWIVGAWAAGALVLALRLLSGYSATRRLLRAHGQRVPEEATALLQRLAARLGVDRTVRLCASGLTGVPAVVGCFRPVVLLPMSALTGLSPSQLEAILAHELAHVRRHDYLVNLLQSLIETLLFYHPAVWWLGARIREEREHCCDDLAVSVCADTRSYAAALLSMEHLRGVPEAALALKRGSLLARVERLLAPHATEQELLPRWTAGLWAAAIALLFASTSDFAGAASKGRPHDAAMGEQALARRIEWARGEAVARGYQEYWIGRSIAAHASHGDGLLLARFDRPGVVIEDARGNPLALTGRITAVGGLERLRLPGVPLAESVGMDPADTGVWFLCSTRSSPLDVRRVYVATAAWPMDLEGLPFFWLGRADDRASIEDTLARLGQASTRTIQQDLIGAIGAHGASSLAVPELTRILGSGSLDDDLRAEAARALGFHPVPEALKTLEGVARGDRSMSVRCEAVEAIGAQRFAPALETLIVLSREHPDRTVRREAVESLGDRTEAAAVQALLGIVDGDLDPAFQREAVETLGEMPDRRGLEALAGLARSHPRADIRKEALETYRDSTSMPGDVEGDSR